MPLLAASRQSPVIQTDDTSWPPEARASMFMFEALSATQLPPRPVDRARVYARMAFVGESADGLSDDVVLYSRDVGYQTVSFIGQHVLLPGQRGMLEMKLSDGSTRKIHAIVRRCRPFAQGWFEGILHCRPPRPLKRMTG